MALLFLDVALHEVTFCVLVVAVAVHIRCRVDAAELGLIQGCAENEIFVVLYFAAVKECVIQGHFYLKI